MFKTLKSIFGGATGVPGAVGVPDVTPSIETVLKPDQTFYAIGDIHGHEFLMAIIIGMVVVILQHRDQKRIVRLTIAACSGCIGFVAAPEIDTNFIGLNTLGVLVTAFSYAIIDVAFGLLRDGDLVRGAVRRAIGMKHQDGDK